MMANFPLQGLASGLLASGLLEEEYHKLMRVQSEQQHHHQSTTAAAQAAPAAKIDPPATWHERVEEWEKQPCGPNAIVSEREKSRLGHPPASISFVSWQDQPIDEKRGLPLPPPPRITPPPPCPKDPPQQQADNSPDAAATGVASARKSIGLSAFLSRAGGKTTPGAAKDLERMATEFCKGLADIQSANDAALRDQQQQQPQQFLVLHDPESLKTMLLPFLRECQAFANVAKDVDISLGYHYTNKEYLPQIRKHGLLTRGERRRRGIRVKDNGSTHGDGIYTSSNPFAFRNFRNNSNAALLVLRLTGNTHKHSSSAAGVKPKVDQLGNTDSLTQQRGIGKDLMVLRDSTQCVVLGEFLPQHLDRSESAERIMVTHGKIRKLIKTVLRGHFRQEKDSSTVDDSTSKCSSSLMTSGLLSEPNKSIATCTNNTSSTTTTKPSDPEKKSREKNAFGSSSVKRHGCLRYGAPRHCLLVCSMKDSANKVEPNEPAADQECSICFEPLRGSPDLMSLKRCDHIFHKECLRDALKHDPKCPICRKVTSEPQGKMPSGKMVIGLDEKLACEGFEPGTWRIRYSMKPGVQKPYHVNPGVAFPATTREAFLPNTEEGRRLLKRLAYAFSRGLTFTVGTSLTSGKENVIIWGSIHHKTKPRNHTYGWPDQSYFLNVNEELDALGVPPHDDPSLHIVFATRCVTSVNFGYLFAKDQD